MTNRILSFIILLTAAIYGGQQSLAFAPSHYESSSLAEGRWVKIAVDTTGIYEISYDQLREYGFSHPEAVAVYGYGGVMAAEQTFREDFPDNMLQTPSILSGNRLLFYAEGPVRASINRTMASTFSEKTDAVFERNTFSNEACYFLSDALPRKEAERTDLSVSTDNPQTWHYCIDLIEREVQNPASGGNIFHGAALNPGDSEKFLFHVRDFDSSVSSVGAVHVKAGAKSDSRTQLPVRFSDNVTSPLSGVSSGINTSKYKMFGNVTAASTFAPAGGAQDVDATLTFSVPATYEGSYAAVDKVYLIYPRANRMPADGELILNLASSDASAVAVQDAPPGLELWNVTNPAAIVRHGLEFKDGAAIASVGGTSSASGNRFVAFDPAVEHRKPRLVGEIKPQNLHAAPVPELLIVTTETLRLCAEELAAIHERLQGMKVLVVSQDEAFNEFGGGTRSAAAIRRMVKMFADRDPGTLRYLLLYGPSSFDNRGIAVTGDYLPCYECEADDLAKDVSANYVSDTYFGIVDDNYVHKNISTAKADVAVGRIPATDVSIASKVNAKIERYLSAPPSIVNYTRLLKFSDDGDRQAHFKNSELFSTAMQKAIPSLTVTHADDLLFPRDGQVAAAARRHLLGSIVRGQGMLYYSGHGKPSSLSAEIEFSIADVSGLRNNVLPLTVFSTCDAYPFDHSCYNISNEMLFNPDGGAIGIIGASRTVYLEHNHTLSMAIGTEYAAAGEGDTGADIFMRARNKLIDDKVASACAINNLCYNYCGDPAVPLPFPSYDIALDPVKDAMEPGVPHWVSGKVVTAVGKTVKDFNGMALIEVYDVPLRRSLFIRAQTDGTTRDIAIDEMLLAEFPVEVKNGQFSAEIVVPVNNSASGTGRMVVSANDASTNKGAVGSYAGITFGDCADLTEAPSTGAPEIVEFYIDPSDCPDASSVNTVFTVHARIRPSASGLSTGFSTIRPVCTLVLDNNISYADAMRTFTYDDDGLACLSVKLGPLGEGQHVLRLEAVNNLGTAEERTLTFVVNPSPTLGQLVIGNDGKAYRDEAVFDLADAGGVSEAHLVVTNLQGQTVFNRQGCKFPYAWNLTGDDGNTVADGHYFAWALIKDGNTRTSTPKIAFTVVK